MSFYDYSQPKNGRIFRVIFVCRISTEHQDSRSLEDQAALYRAHLQSLLNGEYEEVIISSQGSGENLEREEYLQLCEMVESGDFDLVIAEDLGRICRRMQAHMLCELAEDVGTRVIAINDFVDTANEGWQQSTIFASLRHESYNRDTSKRIRRTLRNRFMQGGVVQTLPFGYIKPNPHADDSEIQKVPGAIPVYAGWFDRLEAGQSFQEVADWLNSRNVPVGPYCRSERWNGRMVGRVTRNPILKGVRRRNERLTVRVNRTGRHKTVPAPESEKLKRLVPHLAFVEPDRYDRVIRLLKNRNAKYKRSDSVRNDPRAGVPKRQTRWPGQHIRCGACGRLFVFGGHGRTERLMCSGAREHKCWNGMTVSGPEVARAVADHIRVLIEDLPDFDSTWLAEYRTESDRLLVANNDELKHLNAELESETRKLSVLFDTLNQLGVSDATIERIRQSELRIAELKDRISASQRSKQSQPTLPSLDELRKVAKEVFTDLAVESPEFSRQMRDLVDEFFVLPYRLFDGGHIQPRVIFKVAVLDLMGGHNNSDLPIQQFDCIVDLVRTPQRVAIRAEAAKLADQGLKHAEIAERLGVTKTAVCYALKLHRAMVAQGRTDPWLPVTTAEQAADYYGRIRNKRFEFQPLPGFETTRHPHT